LLYCNLLIKWRLPTNYVASFYNLRSILRQTDCLLLNHCWYLSLFTYFNRIRGLLILIDLFSLLNYCVCVKCNRIRLLGNWSYSLSLVLSRHIVLWFNFNRFLLRCLNRQGLFCSLFNNLNNLIITNSLCKFFF